MPGQRYSEEFKRNAVEFYITSGRSVTAAAEDLGVPNQTLSKWIKKAEADGTITREKKDLHSEVARLKKELAEVKMERDLLKKTAIFFANEK